MYGEKYTKDHYLSFVFFATCSPSFVIPATIPNSQIKCRLKEIERSILMGFIKDIMLNLGSKKSPEIGSPEEGCEVIRVADAICQLNSTLGKLM